MAESEIPTSGYSNPEREVNTDKGNIQEVDSTTGNRVALAGVATLTPNVSEAYTFALEVNHTWVLNKSADTIMIEVDDPATPGSWSIPSTGGMIFDCPCTILYLLSPSATPVNGDEDGNIVIRGWL